MPQAAANCLAEVLRSVPTVNALFLFALAAVQSNDRDFPVLSPGGTHQAVVFASRYLPAPVNLMISEQCIMQKKRDEAFSEFRTGSKRWKPDL